MDQKLYMPEILDRIFAYFGPVHPLFSPAPGTLASLARTCRTFQDSALNALWAAQTSLLPALGCFPDDLWEPSTDPEKLSFVEFRRPLVPADWERPLFYWDRIKSFEISSFDPNRSSPAVLETLRICCPTSHLFPNLRKIAWLDAERTHSPLLAVFLSPRVYSIVLYPGESLMQLSGARHGPLFLATLLDLLSSLERLESLHIRSADAAIFDHISARASFKSFIVNEPWELDFMADHDSVPRLTALEVLSLWSTTQDACTTIVGSVAHRGLREINLRFESVFPDAQATHRLYSAIDPNGSYHTLTTLHIEDEAINSGAQIPPDDEFDSYIVRGETLTILFLFTNLTHINLEPFHGFDLDDALVARMACSWSRVEELKLAFSMDWHIDGEVRPARTTLVGIHAIAKHSLNLRTLKLYFDATTIPVIERMAIQTNPRHFYVFCSPITSPTAVAEFLSNVFPRLSFLHPSCCDDFDNRPQGSAMRHWKRVEKIIGDRDKLVKDRLGAA
ncbi:hypothetical protein MSAN_01226300 [Mycena sanguinolenta]|uniref:F-box domain-containing protein n=1 Tax=Mycena sanguinolenta TaxID=230812 RepID=A0A8H6YGU8_9AGAR|nr:hypothetical protein MSAN_01226300 [Mycena sanguinolenta]